MAVVDQESLRGVQGYDHHTRSPAGYCNGTMMSITLHEQPSRDSVGKSIN